MARPLKQGVDYFPHDIDSTSRKTLTALEAKFGNDGYAFWFKLLELLGAKEGLYFDCSDDSEWLFLVAKTRVSEVSATEILDTLSRLGAIDPGLWKNRIIWVQNFVNRVADVYTKRKQKVPAKPIVDSNFRSENYGSAGVSVAESTQSKLNKSKSNQINTPPTPPPGEAPDGAEDATLLEQPQKPLKAKRKKTIERDTLRQELHAAVEGLTANENVRRAARDWIDARLSREKKDWPTVRAIELAFNQLRDWEYSEKQAVECFAQSVIGNWKGLFQLRGG